MIAPVCKHETDRAINRGRCHPCYQRYRYRMLAYGKWDSERVDLTPVRAHLRELKAAGIGSARVGELCGVAAAVIQRFNRSDRKWCKRHLAEKILAIPLPTRQFGEEVAEGAFIPADGTRRRLQSLAANGYTIEDLGSRLGKKFQYISVLQLGRTSHVTARVAREVDALFRELQLIPGPSNAARKRAARMGWNVPFAWDEDEIDNPLARPHAARIRTLKGDWEIIDRMLAQGQPLAEIAAELGMQPESLRVKIWRRTQREKLAG